MNCLCLFPSGYRSIELKPLAAVSVELSCSSRELQVIGPIQIILPLPDNSGLRVSDPVPAWAFHSQTGTKRIFTLFYFISFYFIGPKKIRKQSLKHSLQIKSGHVFRA